MIKNSLKLKSSTIPLLKEKELGEIVAKNIEYQRLKEGYQGRDPLGFSLIDWLSEQLRCILYRYIERRLVVLA